MERSRLDAAAAKEEREDEEALEIRAAKQQQEKLFIQQYLTGRKHVKLNQALDHAAEDARSDLESA